jgi:protein-S-isoprenylcysteine O-methyltransferase Ste14
VSFILLIGVTIFLGEGEVRIIRLFGALLGLFSLPLVFLPMFTLRRHGGVPRGESYMATRKVVDRGLLGVVRHPQYLGYLGLAASFALSSQRWFSVALALLVGGFFFVHARAEEAHLRESLGPAYTAYASRVPRFNILLGLYRAYEGRKGRRGPPSPDS